MHTKNNLVLIFIASTFFALSCTVGYLLFNTTKGAEVIARIVLYYFTRSQDVSIEKVEGTILTKASLHNIEILNPHKLPKGALVRIQRLDLFLSGLRAKTLVVNIYNGKLQLPFSDPILFYGDYKNSNLDLTLYSKRVSAREIIDLFTKRPVLSTLFGIFSDVNIHIAGTLSELAAEGSFQIDSIVKERFSILNCQGSLLMYCDNLFEAAKLNGEIALKKGVASGGKTANINLEQSKIIFDGDPKHPKLNIRGSAVVEDVSISIVLQGTIDEPDLTVSSVPVLSQDLLLIMLATGRGWGGTQTAMQNGQLSADLIKDFVDYFIFSGQGSNMGQRFGISDISVFYHQQTGGMGVTTSVVDKLKVGYEVEPPQTATGDTVTKQTVKGEVKITDTISVGAEKELTTSATKQSEQVDDQKETDPGEEKVYLQFKKQF